MSDRNRKQNLLRSLLIPLVREWGYPDVRRCLAELESRHQEHGDHFSGTGGRAKTTTRHRPSAVDLANRAETSESRKPLLLSVASKFDSRAFLPSGVDVRHFLEMRGEKVDSIKKRADSFSKVLSVLLLMTEDELKMLAETDTHGGPAQLGPLSDAIKATGTAIRTREVQTEEHSEEVGHDPNKNNQITDK